MPSQRRGRRPYDWFNYGRQEAGMGWYQPGPSGWLAIAAPAVQGAARGLGTYMSQRTGASLTDQLNAGQPVTPTSLESVPAVAPTSLEAVPPGTPPGAVPGQNPLAPDRPWTDPWAGRGALAPDQPWSRNPPPLTPEERAKRRVQQWKWQQLGMYSSRALKSDITRADERRSLREVLSTPVYTYRYHDEATPERIGPMAEEVPPSWQMKIGETAGIRMPVMLGALHAATRALARDVRALKDQLRG